MKILIVGSGGREHALVWKISKSPKVTKLYAAPGNVGMKDDAELIDIPVTDIDALLAFAKYNKIDLTVVGPEVPLVAGIVDRFQQEGMKIFGPTAAGAQLEGSKLFAKKMMQNCKIPTAAYKVFDSYRPALEHIFMSKFPVVIKADGLAAGKGVTVAKSLVEAKNALKAVFEAKIFGEAGSQVVIEEFMSGQEASVLAITDGKDFVCLPAAQDHKRVYDADEGPNTGGMGAYAPTPFYTREIADQVQQDIIKPLIKGLQEENIDFKGVIYAGLMLTNEGPKVVEFNVRFGDPEIEAILPLIDSDLIDLFFAAIDGTIKDFSLKIKDQACLTVVAASDGYPQDYKKGYPIEGLDSITGEMGVVFHAGTSLQDDQIVTNGGRVLAVTACGDDLAKAKTNCYKLIKNINFKGMHYRTDIGAKALK